ncbi:MAG: rhomboid family intramembrane serine protease [Mucilaginibacter sp.]
MAWAWGITPYRRISIPLEDYNADHYLTLLYQAMTNRGWHIGYFDHDGIIAYTNISWESYSEEISARVIGNTIAIKSECVGYQGFLTDYSKNQKNLDLLLGEIPYAEFHMQGYLEETTLELMSAVPENQFLNLEDPPMAGKEQLRGFFSPFIPRKKYFITPLLVILNTVIFFVTILSIYAMIALATRLNDGADQNVFEKIYLFMGFSSREQVLNGQVWRLLTSIFLHFSFMHLLFNMIALVYIGSLIECKLGRWNFLMMYLFTGITASMVSTIWNSGVISGGASGAIFGLFGILLALLSTNFYERSARKALLISTAIFVAYNIIPVGRGIDHAAHFGGLISGYIFGWIAYLGLNHRNQLIQKWGIALSGTLIVIAFVSASLVLTPQYQLKEMDRLNGKYETLCKQIYSQFYGNAYADRKVKLDSIEQRAFPELKSLKLVGDQLVRLSLPSKKKREAKYRAEIINLQLHYYKLLYLEFKHEDNFKYRYQIEATTARIDSIQIAWGKFVTGN